MTTMTVEWQYVALVVAAFGWRFPYTTLIVLCCLSVVVVPSFTLAMGAWALAVTLIMARWLVRSRNGQAVTPTPGVPR